mgnify:CR=1 FL=1
MTRLHRCPWISPSTTARDCAPPAPDAGSGRRDHPRPACNAQATDPDRAPSLHPAPTAGKALKNELAGLRSYLVGRVRIVDRLAGECTIEIVAIGPRRTTYEETYRLLRRG